MKENETFVVIMRRFLGGKTFLKNFHELYNRNSPPKRKLLAPHYVLLVFHGGNKES